MRLVYTLHSQERAKSRKVKLATVQEILLNRDRGFVETETGYLVATKRNEMASRCDPESDILYIASEGLEFEA